MEILNNFKFSASNLKDYLECPRRFELRYLKFLEWPAIQTEPVLDRERFIEDGKAFHHLIFQHLNGIPEEAITPFIKGAALSRWWQIFTIHQPHLQVEGQRLPELKVVVPFEGFILTGQFDLLVQTPENNIIIYDWKTTSRKPNITTMRRSIQSRLYPFLISNISQENPGKFACLPDEIKLVYWFPDYPENTITINYSAYQFEEDLSFFKFLLSEISGTEPGGFRMTQEENRCLYCQYRSLCSRGEKAGDWKQNDESVDLEFDTSIEIDLDLIPEIEY